MPTATSPMPAARSPSTVSRTANQHTPEKDPAMEGVSPADHLDTELNSRCGVAE